MPKIVDHERRREEIAHVACQVIARHGFEQATVARIARSAGFTTGMVAHYFESKQQIVIAALRLILTRMEQRLVRSSRSGETRLFKVLSEGLPLDAQRFAECAFWTAFWGQVAVDPAFKRINAAIHREYQRLYERCFEQCWPQKPSVGQRHVYLRREALADAFHQGRAGAEEERPRPRRHVARRHPAQRPLRFQFAEAERQIEQLRLQLEMLERWSRERKG